MVEDITTALSRVRWLFVIARNSSFAYKGKAIDVKQVGRELGVRYVLEGSIRKSKNQVRITGQLIDASTGGQLWAGRCEGNLEDVFDLQDQIAESVVGQIARAATGFAHLLAGRYDEAISWAQKACLDQPNFPVAWRLLASSSALSGRLDQGQKALARDLQLDPGFGMSTLSGTFRRAEDFERYAEGLRLMGCPSEGYTAPFASQVSTASTPT